MFSVAAAAMEGWLKDTLHLFASITHGTRKSDNKPKVHIYGILTMCQLLLFESLQ